VTNIVTITVRDLFIRHSHTIVPGYSPLICDIIKYPGGIFILDQLNNEESLKKIRSEIKHRKNIEEVLNSASVSLLSKDAIPLDLKIEKILEKMGRLAKIDRSYIFLFSEDGSTMSNTHEWAADGISKEKKNLQNIPVDIFPWWTKQVKNNLIINIQTVSEMESFAPAEKEILESQDIKSLYVTPLYIENKTIGFIGFDSVREEKIWTEKEITFLETVKNIISSAIEREKYEMEILERKNYYQTLFENSNDGIFIIDKKGNHVQVNLKGAEMLGYTQDEIITLGYKDLIFPDQLADSEEKLWNIISGNVPPPYEKIMLKKDGSLLPVEIHLSVIRDSRGKVEKIQSIVRDISTRKDSQAKIKALTFFKNSIFQVINETLSGRKTQPPLKILLDLCLKVIETSNHGWIFETYYEKIIPVLEIGEMKNGLSYKNILELQSSLKNLEDVRVFKASDLFLSMDIPLDTTFLVIPIRKEKNNFFIFFLKQAENSQPIGEFEIEIGVFLKKHLETMMQRVTLENKLIEKQKQLSDLASIDNLTGFYNRRRFTEISFSKLKPNTEYALLYLDLDKFKEINDILGHTMGDLILKKLSERIKVTCSEEDVISRLGGDEFAILVKNSNREDLQKFSHNLFEAIKGDYNIEGWHGKIRASIGIACYPKDASDFSTLLKNADIAMYESKSRKNHIEFFDKKYEEKIRAKLNTEREIERGLLRNSFILYYQPIVRVTDKTVKGYEGLIRWNHETKGILTPYHFIPFAEKTGLLAKIDEKVRHIASLKLAEWQEKRETFTLSVNVSAKEFIDPEFKHRIEKLLLLYGFDADKMIIEITENSFLDDFDLCIENMNYLKKLGFRFSIDDFGTGYSSLSYLQKIPADYLKIDREFVTDIDKNEKKRIIVESTINVSHKLGLETISEGVETEEEFRVIKDLNSDYIQGYLFGRPSPI